MNSFIKIGEQQTFGQLQLEAIGIGPAHPQQVEDVTGKIRVPELARAHVDRDAELLGVRIGPPGHQLGASRLQHPLAQGKNQAGLLRYRNKRVRGHHAFDWMLPAQQGLDPGHAAFQVHHRLVIQNELFGLHALAQIGLHAGALGRGRLHLGVEKAQGVAARPFGLVHGQVGAFEQLLDAELVLEKKRHPDAGGAVHVVITQRKLLAERGEHFFGHQLRLTGSCRSIGIQFLEHDHEFIAPEAGDRIHTAHTLLQTL